VSQPHQLRVLDRDRFRLPNGQPCAVDPLIIHCIGMAHNLRGGWGAWSREERDAFLDLLRHNLDYCYGTPDDEVRPLPAATAAPASEAPSEPIPERFRRRNSWTLERRMAQSEKVKQTWTPERRARYAEMARARFGKDKDAAEGAAGDGQS
jgi:hypothetical protein